MLRLISAAIFAALLTACSSPISGDVNPTKDSIMIGDHILQPGTYQVLYTNDENFPVIRYDNHNYHYDDYSVIKKIN